jgi:hypothetical protein
MITKAQMAIPNHTPKNMPVPKATHAGFIMAPSLSYPFYNGVNSFDIGLALFVADGLRFRGQAHFPCWKIGTVPSILAGHRMVFLPAKIPLRLAALIATLALGDPDHDFL